jgi:hypothetical protein
MVGIGMKWRFEISRGSCSFIFDYKNEKTIQEDSEGSVLPPEEDPSSFWGKYLQ